MIGVYIRGLKQSIHGTPKQAAKKADDHGVSFVAIMACWQDRRKDGTPYMLHSNGRDGSLIARYAEAFVAADVDVWLWGYPWAGREQQYLDRLGTVTDRCGGTRWGQGIVDGWLHDPEKGFKWGKLTGMTENFVKSSAVKLRLAVKDSGCPQGVTSYGMAHGHRTFPWVEFASVGFGSPQLYTVGPADIDRGIAQWRELGWSRIVPSVPLYGRNSGAHLHDHLSCFVDGDEDIDGLIFWSWRQASADEWRVIARWSEWLRRGMCVAA